MKISVNILVWNNQRTIGKTLTNIYNDVKDMSHEFIIVDNGSTDNSCDIISDWITRNLSDNFSFVRNKENLGISIGKNRGIGLSKGQYVLMVDGDVLPVPNSIKMMVDWMDKNVDKCALGMYPNKFVTSPDMAEPECREFISLRTYKCCCLYYGIFRRIIFDNGLRMSEEGEFGKPGYGWEDHDFFKKMQQAGIDQYVVNINSERGRYYHNINSSIRAMGHEEYVRTSRLRDKQFKKKWESNSDAAGQDTTKTSRRARRSRRKDRE